MSLRSSWLESAGDMARSFTSPAEALGRLGRLAVGSAVASASLATRGIHLGVRAGARVASSAAAKVEGTVPGAGMARRLAATVDEQTTAAAEASRRLAAEGMERMNGVGAVGDPEVPAAGMNGNRSWTELAADTAIGPLGHVAGLTVALGADVLREAAGTRPSKRVLEAGIERLRTRTGAGDGHFETGEQRDSLVAVATDSGAAAMRETFGLAEAMARMAFSDTRRMRRILEHGLEEMRHLASSAQMQDLLPTPILGEPVLERARLIVDRQPRRLLRALEDSNGSSADFATIAEAALADVENLRVFFVLYPQVMALAGTDVVKLLLAGSLSFTELEAFLEGRRSGPDSRPADTP